MEKAEFSILRKTKKIKSVVRKSNAFFMHVNKIIDKKNNG